MPTLPVGVPLVGSLRPVALAIAVLAAVLLLRRRWPVLRTLEACAAAGLLAGLVG